MLIALWLDNRAAKPMFYHTDKHGGSALLTATEPAVRMAVKTKLSYRNDPKVNVRILGFYLDEEQQILFKKKDNYYPTWRHSTNNERVAIPDESDPLAPIRILKTQNASNFSVFTI